MKKLILLLSGITVLSTVACRKKEMPPKPAIQQTVNVQLKANEAYTFVLPKNKRNDEYEITSSAQHATISQLGVDASGNRIYQYTPVSNFTGIDQVIVANDEELRERHEHPKPRFHLFPHHGDCDKDKGGEEDHYIITLNFTIADTQSSGNTVH